MRRTYAVLPTAKTTCVAHIFAHDVKYFPKTIILRSGTLCVSLIHKSEKCRRVAEVGGVLRGSAQGAKTAEVAGSMGKLRERIDIPSRLNSNFAVQAQAFTRQSRLSRRWRCLYCARLWHVPSGGAIVGLYGRGAQ